MRRQFDSATHMRARRCWTSWKSAIGRAELRARLGVVARDLEAALGDAVRQDREAAALGGEARLHVVALRVRRRRAGDRAGMRTSSRKTSPVGEPRMPIFFIGGPVLRPGVGALDDERLDRAVELAAAHPGVDQEHVGVGRVGDERLAAVQHVVVAVAPSRRLHAAQGVAAGPRLGESPRADASRSA